jgi:DNA-binding NarL/FixJ family response regulator
MIPDRDHLASRGKIAVCIAFSDPALARRVASLLASDSRLKVCFDLNDAPDADVILADHALPSLLQPVIIIDDSERGPDAGDADVRAILPRTVDGDLLRAAVMIVAAGFMISEMDGLRGLFDEPSRVTRSLDIDEGEITLTAREGEVLDLLAHGASNKIIARELKISIHTAKFHVASVLAKLGARNRSDAVAIGVRRGLILL